MERLQSSLVGAGMRTVIAGLLLASATAAPAAQWPEAIDSPVSLNETWLAMRTKLALLQNPAVTGAQVDDIVVIVEGRRVALRGRVASADARAAAEVTAASMAGIDAVQNHLTVEPADIVTVEPSDQDLAAQVRRSIRRLVPDARVRVRSRDRIVTLRGTVADLPAQVAAAEVARSVLGVRAVRALVSAEVLALESRR